MKIENVEQLKELLKVCHENRVSSIAVDGIVMQVNLRPEQPAKAPGAPDPVIGPHGFPMDPDEVELYESIKRNGSYQKGS